MPRATSTRCITFLSRVAVISLWMTSIISLALMTPSPLASAACRRSLSELVRPGASRRSATFRPLAAEVMVSFRALREIPVECKSTDRTLDVGVGALTACLRVKD